VDRGKIIDALGLITGGTFAITDVKLSGWGRDLIFECHYSTLQPDGTPDPAVIFRLIFRDCREMKWRSYAHIALSELGEIANRTEIAEIALGSGGHRRDANLLTSHFAATISYGEVLLEHEEKTYHLPA
jgi:hypothetical protein